MANRYEAKAIRPKTGIVKNDHKVKMSDGTSLQVIRKGSIKGERNRVRDAEIKDAKRRILNRIPLQERKIRGTMLRAIDDFELIVLKLERLGGRDRQGNLKVVEKSKLLRTCNKFSKNKVKELKNRVELEIESSVKTYMIGIRRSLPNRDLLSMDKIKEIAKRKAKEIMKTKIAGASTNQRINRYGLKIRDGLMNHAELNKMGRIANLKKLKKNFVDPKNSHRSCIARGVARITRTEQNRAMHEAVLEFMQANNFEFVYWRLSNAHKSYGGNEVCEVLATNTGEGVEKSLLQSNNNLNRSGLYLADAFT